ncbi:MAG: ABC transporter permease [Adhaeribacter sp.]
MFYNYLKIAVRTLLRHRFYTFINMAGLTLGISCCLLIFLFVRHELSYDQFHQQGDRLYRVLRLARLNGAERGVPYTSGPYARALAQDFPGQVAAAVRVMPVNALLTYRNRSFKEEQVILADSNFFSVFSFALVKGDPRTALSGTHSLVLSQTTAKKYFGSANPLGKLITVDKTSTYQVTGVMADVPANSHLQFDLVASIKPQEREDWFYVWRNNAMFTYVLLNRRARLADLEARFPAFMTKYLSKEFKEWGGKMGLRLQPMKDIYMHEGLVFDNVTHGSKNNVYIFSAIAGFILLIAGINFMNLASARSAGRAREVGVRKVLGAYRRHLVAQFLSESTLLALLAVGLSLGLIVLVLPYFNALSEKQLAIPFGDPLLYVWLLGLALVVGLLAGSYPAFFLSSFQPVNVLKGRLSSGGGHPMLRRALVVFQFSISIFLLIGTVVIYRQMYFLQHKNLGFNKEHVLKIRIDNGEIHHHRQAFLRRVKQLPGVLQASVMSGEPGGFHDQFGFEVSARPGETWRFNTVFTDFDYLPTLGIQLVAGRNLSRAFPSDSTSALLLNQQAAAVLGWTPHQALGQEISDKGFGSPDVHRRRVVGVVKDYHFSSLKDPINPLAILMRPDHRMLVLRLAPGNPAPVLAAVRQVYGQMAPQYPFQYSFLDDDFDHLYKTEQKQAQLFTIFSALAIFIACLGLFGLAAYTTEQRRKEIGIRKILGASAGGLVALVSRDFIRLVLLANILAWPLAYLAMQRWLEHFSYRIGIGWYVFLAAGLLALVIALLTISFQALKVALANPVESLRDE